MQKPREEKGPETGRGPANRRRGWPIVPCHTAEPLIRLGIQNKKGRDLVGRGLGIRKLFDQSETDLPESVRVSNLSLATRRPVRVAIRVETILRTP